MNRFNCRPTPLQAILATLAFTLLSFAGCGGQSEDAVDKPLETIDLSPPPAIDPENDPKAVPRAPTLTGQMPGGFPSDVPLHLPASLIDFGTTTDGLGTVTLLSPAAPDSLRQELEAKLHQAGWSVTKARERAGRKVIEKGGRKLWLRIEDARPGSHYTFEYRPE